MQNFRFHIKLVLLMLLITLLSNCTESAQPINTHEKAKVVVIKDQSDGSTPPSEHILETSVANLFAPERLRTPGYGSSLAERTALFDLNQMMLNQVANSDASAIRRISQIYMGVLNLDCGGTVSYCPGIQVLRRVYNSSQVLHELALRESGKRSYLLLSHAYLVKNSRPDMDLQSTLIVRAKEYSRLDLSPQELEQFRSVITTVLLSLQNSSGFQWPEGIDPWELAFDRHLGLSTQVKVVLSQFILGQRLEGMGKFVAKDGSESVSSLQLELKKNSQIDWRYLGFSPIDRPSYFYQMMDLVSTGAMEAEWASALMESVELTPQLLQEELKSFLRTHFLAGVSRATKIAVERVFKLDSSGQDMFFNALKQSSEVREVWSALRDRMSLIQKYALQVAKNKKYSASEIASIRRLFDGLDPSIRMAVLYPHLMILFHQLSKKNFTMRLRLGVYDAADFMIFLYNGDLPPILPYVDEHVQLSPSELLYSFDLGVRTGVFSAVGLDVDEFIASTLSRFSELSLKQVADQMNEKNLYVRGSTEFPEFKRVCDDVVDGVHSTRTIFWTDLRMSPYLGLSKMEYLQDLGLPSQQTSAEVGSVGHTVYGFNFLDRGNSEMMERARIDMETVIRMGEAMKISYQAVLRPEERETKLVKTSEVISKVKTLQKQYVDQFLDLRKSLGSCFIKLAEKDRQIQMQLMAYEREYLTQVGRDVLRLRTLTSEDPQTTQILNQYNERALYKGFVGVERISVEGYRFFPADLYMRLIRYMKEGLKTDSANLPAIAPHLQFNFGDGSLNPSSKSMESMEPTTIAFDSMDSFLGSATRLYLNGLVGSPGDSKSWLDWESFSDLLAWSDRVMPLVSLYRARHGDMDQVITADEILDAHEEMFSLTHMSSLERKLLAETHDTFKYNNLLFKNILGTYKMSKNLFVEFWGLYDLPYKMVQAPLLGRSYYIDLALSDPNAMGDKNIAKVFAPKRQGVLELAADYYHARNSINRKALWVDLSSLLDQELDRRMLAYYNREVGAADDLLKAIEMREKRHQQMPVALRPFVTLTDRQDIRGPAVRPILALNRQAELRVFNERTGFCFSTNMQCPEFVERH